MFKSNDYELEELYLDEDDGWNEASDVQTRGKYKLILYYIIILSQLLFFRWTVYCAN